MKKSDILAELRRHPDKIFHLLRENDFERAKKLFGTDLIRTGEWYIDDIHPDIKDRKVLTKFEFHLQQLILAPDVLGYLEEYGKEGKTNEK